MKTRLGKIARLPRTVRNELNQRLDDGEPGHRLVEWLNGLPEVQAVLAAEFAGWPINAQNLTDWKQGGHRDWIAQQDTLELVQRLREDAAELRAEGRPSLMDSLALWLVARYAVAARLIAQTEGAAGFRLLRELCADVVKLRRSDHSAERLRMERERAERELAAHRKKTEDEMFAWAMRPDIREQIRSRWRSVREEIKKINQARLALFGVAPGATPCPCQEPSAGPSPEPANEPESSPIKANQAQSKRIAPDPLAPSRPARRRPQPPRPKAPPPPADVAAAAPPQPAEVTGESTMALTGPATPAPNLSPSASPTAEPQSDAGASSHPVESEPKAAGAISPSPAVPPRPTPASEDSPAAAFGSHGPPLRPRAGVGVGTTHLNSELGIAWFPGYRVNSPPAPPAEAPPPEPSVPPDGPPTDPLLPNPS
jgi:hypothetical protein